jgi:hypothetical protein
MKCTVANIFAYPTLICCGCPIRTPPCLRVIRIILNLFEQGFNRLLWIPCSIHVFKVDFKIHRGDVAVSSEQMVQYVPSVDVGKTNHVIIQNVQVNWLKNTDDLLFQSLLHGSVCAISLNVFLQDVTRCTNLGGCAVSVGWIPPGGCWLTHSVGPASVAGAIMA